MAKNNPTSRADRTSAVPNGPALTVYCLSEFAFCPRAGICAHEQEKEPEPPPRRANLSYMPIYDREELARKFQCLLRLAWHWTLGAIGAAVLVELLVRFMGWPFVVACALILASLLAGACPAMFVVRDAFLCFKHLAIWNAAQPRLPDPDDPRPQLLHWCELLAAGLTSRSPRAPYHDQAWRLGGRPWRVLYDGDVRIPVFLYHGDSDRIQPSHYVRMAAYCHLVEMCEGFGSPYGIVLWAGTYRAMSVPNTPQARRELHEQVVRAKEAIRAAEHRHKLPKPPSRKSLCERCPLGKPVAYVPGEGFSRHGVPLRVYKVQNDGMKFYHSHCGDRFRWVPPHAKALDLDLMPLSTAKILATLISTDEWL